VTKDELIDMPRGDGTTYRALRFTCPNCHLDEAIDVEAAGGIEAARAERDLRLVPLRQEGPGGRLIGGHNCAEDAAHAPAGHGRYGVKE
jgi:hypothetical protein